MSRADFESNLPYSIRCRTALLAMPSRYPTPESAIEASPEPSRRSMTVSFHVGSPDYSSSAANNKHKQTNLALNIAETVINLHRPYYARALYDDVINPVKSRYAPSFLAVIERCSARIYHYAAGNPANVSR